VSLKLLKSHLRCREKAMKIASRAVEQTKLHQSGSRTCQSAFSQKHVGQHARLVEDLGKTHRRYGNADGTGLHPITMNC
jgi:hypothetical protein